MIARYVRRIDGNVKSGVAADLGPLTLVVGPNAAGKSALVAALELALTGRTAETGATPATILELTSAPPLDVTATWDRGGEIHFRVEGTTAKGKTAQWYAIGEGVEAPIETPQASLLVSEVRDILSREPKRQRAAILRAACGEIRETVIRAAVPEAFRTEWDRYGQAARGEGREAADVLIAVREAIRKDLRIVRAESKGDLGPRPEAPSQEVIADLERQIDARRASILARQRWEAAMAAIPWLEREIEKLQETGGEDLAFVKARAEVLAYAARVALFMVELMRRSYVTTAGVELPCPCCEQRPKTKTWADTLLCVQERARKAEEAWRMCEAQRKTDPGAQRLDDLVDKLRAATEAIRTEPPAVGRVLDANELERTIETARSQRVAQDAWDARRQEQVAMAARIDGLVALGKAADRVIAESLDGAIAAFCARAPDLAIELYDRGREVCRVGLRGSSNGHVRSWRVLSGAERAQFLASFAAAWGAMREGPKIVIVDDVWLGAEALASLCTSLAAAVRSGAVTQAIVCVVERYGLAPTGWTIVEVDPKIAVQPVHAQDDDGQETLPF